VLGRDEPGTSGVAFSTAALVHPVPYRNRYMFVSSWPITSVAAAMRVGGLRVDGIFVASVEDVAIVPHHLSVSEFSKSVFPAQQGDEFICFLPDPVIIDKLPIMFSQYFAAHPDIFHIIFESSHDTDNAILKVSIVLENTAIDSRRDDTYLWQRQSR
jgi:hypothetical protein